VEFGWPVMLWGLLLIPALAWGYVRMQRNVARRQRLADPHLAAVLWQRPPAVRRLLPLGLYGVAVTLLLFAVARPIAAVPLPVNRAALILAIDVSKSMIGDDVKPSRLAATKESALEALEAVPRSTQVGIVIFSDYAQVLVPPTTDRQQLREAIDNLKLLQSTGVGGAIVEALRALPGRKEFLGDKLNIGRQFPGQPAPLPSLPPQTPGQPPAPLRAEDLPPAAIIIFSDGVSNMGVDPAQAAALAKEGRVRIFGVGVGTPAGSVMTIDGQLVLVPFDSRVLQQIAQLADGRYLDITQKDELKKAYEELGRSIGWERQRTEISSIVVGGAGMLLVAGGLLSLVWFRRVP
jgi:Ca-activated chloride channel family protein